MSNLGALDMALDDVISQNRKRSTNRRSDTSNKGGINKRRPGARPSSSKRYPNYLENKKPYNRPRRNAPNNSNINSRHNNANKPSGSSLSRSTNSNSLVVSNLDYNVTEKDLYDLFGQIGKLRKAFLHIAPNGRSAGIADVVFVNSNDAERARVTYNNVQLDGRPMRIAPASIISAVSTSNVPRGSRNSNHNNNNNSGRRPMRGGRKETRSKPNQQDLDADMDSYMGVNNEDTQMN